MPPLLLRWACAAAAALLAPGAWALWPSERAVLVGDAQGVVSLVDVESGKVLRAFPRSPQLRKPGRGAGPALVSYDAKAPLRLQNPHQLEAEVVLARDGSRFAQTGQDTFVWDLRSGKLELVVRSARALGFLGAGHDRLAVASQVDGVPEFAIWHVAAGRKVFSRRLPLPGVRHVGLPLASSRYAAFALDQMELWLWDDEKQSLRRLDLPPDFFITPPLVISADGAQLLVPGLAERYEGGMVRGGERQIVALAPASGKTLRRYRVPSGNPPKVLGWTLGGKHIVAHRPPDMLLFDAGTGELAHRWDYTPAIRLERDARGLKLDLPRGPLREEPAFSPHGDRLALVDPHGKSIVAWDIRVVPPRRVDDLCGGGRCGERLGTLSFPWFSPDGRSLVVHEEGRLWRVDTYSGAVRELRVAAGEIAARLEQAEVPVQRPETCDADRRACAEIADAMYRQSSPCTPAHPESYSCRVRKDAVPWVKALCVRGATMYCQYLEALAKGLQDAALQRLAFAGYCASTRDGCGKPGDALGAEERGALVAQCTQDAESCWLAAATAANAAGGAALAGELARRGCRAGQRKACMAGSLHEEACAIKEDKDCLEALRAASKSSRTVVRREPPPAVEAPELCEKLAWGQWAGVRVFEGGDFAGVKVTALMPRGRAGLPFREGDLLLNTIRCKPEGCSAEHFAREMHRLCRIDRQKLLHDLRLEVRSADPKRSRAYLLRKAG